MNRRNCFAGLVFSCVILSALEAQELPKPYPASKTGFGYMANYYLPPAPSSYPWWPAWSPDGKWIAFAMHGSIWKIAVGSTIAHELTYDRNYHSSPDWSPNGKWIVYTSDNDSESVNLMVLNLSTGVSAPLTHDQHLNLDPVWSPDGKHIAYVSTHPNGYFNLFVMEFNEGKPGKISQLTEDNRYGKERLYFGDYDLHIEPTWSPDGKEIIFVSNRGISLGSGAVWRMPAEPGGIAKAVMIRKEETLFRTRPDWSPDGKRIIYSSHVGGQFNNLFVLPAVGGEPYKMTFGEWDAFHPRWSTDGEWIVYVSNQEGLPQLRLLKTFGGKQLKLQILDKLWKRPMGRINVRIEDGPTHQAIPARVFLRASDGKTYAPEDAPVRIGGRLAEHVFYSRGEFSMELPPGDVRLEVDRGFEYWPVSQTHKIDTGKSSTARLVLQRMTDMNRRGWYSGDNHVHMNYGGNLHMTPEQMLNLAAAVDLNVVSVLVANKDNRIFDYQHFTGNVHQASTEKQILRFDQEFRPAFHGHISFINLMDHLISPFTTGYEGTAIDSPYPSNTDMLRLAGQQGGLGAYVHAFAGSSDPLEGDLGGAKAFPVDLALGTIAYHELLTYANQAGFRVWHHALNSGYQITGVGGEDTITDLQRRSLIGQARSYAYLGPRLTWQGWIDAIRKGAVFVTNGPLLEFTVNGQIAGEEVSLPAGGGKVKIEAGVQSIVPVDKIEIVFKGKVVATVPPVKRNSTKFSLELPVTESGWFTLQASGPGPVHLIDDLHPQASTNPVWVLVGGQPVRSAESARYFMRWIDRLTDMTRQQPGWRSAREKQHVLEQYLEARKIYERLASEDEKGR